VNRPHLIDGEFQSDKYPTCPRGKVPLSCKDPTAQDLLWEYAQRRRAVDAEFADDLEAALRNAGYEPPAWRPSIAPSLARSFAIRESALQRLGERAGVYEADRLCRCGRPAREHCSATGFGGCPCDGFEPA
jgi:hypothetical protein